MNINNSSQINFNGGFRFPQMPVSTRNELPNFITTKKQIFDNFGTKGDVFLVTRDKTNCKVAEFIRKYNLNFEFYPSINTKCGLDTEKPEGLMQLLSSIREKPITTKSQLLKSLKNQKRSEFIELASTDYTGKILKALKINEDLPTKKIKGVTVALDEEFQRKIFISPPSKLSIHYVKVEPSNIEQGIERYAIDSEGNILAKFQTPDSIKVFNQRFNRLLVK